MASAPLFTAFVVIALHHSFRLHWMTKLGIVTVATGMCLIWFDNHVIQQLPAAGFYLALGAALAWACYSALLKSVLYRSDNPKDSIIINGSYGTR